MSRLTANLRWLVVACVSFRLIWACSNFIASFFQLARACESFEHKTQVDASLSSPARALELAEVSELYIGDSIYRVHWLKFITCDDLCRRLTGGIASHRKLTCGDLRSRLIRALVYCVYLGGGAVKGRNDEMCRESTFLNPHFWESTGLTKGLRSKR